jgi:hypothetical protein
MLDYRRKSSIFANTNLNKNVMNKKTLKAFLLTFCILLNQRVVLSQVRSEPGRYDILITEIMAKPAPEVGLPPVEYLELHSRLPYPVTLQNWRLTLGNTNKSLPNITLDSCGYAVLIAQKWLEDFASVCDNIYILSSLAITDGGQALTLYNQNGEVIHYVSFKPEWHTEKIKQEGGWSLEIIDEGWPCAGGWNWNSSVDPLGGTPGRPNSIRNSLYDNTEPHITGVTLRDSVTLRVHFSKTLAQDTKNPMEFFRAEPYLKVLTVNEVQPDFASWDIRFSEAVEPSTVYRLLAAGEVSDCGGTRWEISEAVPFGRASPPEHNDLVINEILTNALGDENADYLEIYNRSSKIIDLKDVKVGYGGDTLPQKAVFALSKGFQMPPGTYLALCKRRNLTMEQYVCRDEKALADCDSLPDFATTKGIIYLTDRSLRTIDRLAYTEEMHYSKLLTVKGVSLERLYPDMPTQDENNWRSAAESAGFGTPGYRNSQAGNALESSGFEIIPDVFSPDNDGFDDYTEVVCTFPDEENRVNIVLYNNRGHPVKRLANNILCGSEARFRWDGTDDNNQPAPAGMYAVQIECWNLRTQKTLRKRLVAAIYR